MTKQNINCLEGIACPMCGQATAFFIEASVRLHVTDDGTEDQGGDHTWGDDAPFECVECGHSGTLAEFYVGGIEPPSVTPTPHIVSAVDVLIDRAREVVACWSHGDLASAVRGLDEALPDAAVVPELLAAAQAALEYLTDHAIDLEGEPEELLARIRIDLADAIAKAKGGAA